MEVGFGDRRDSRLYKRELIYSKRARQEIPPNNNNEIFVQQVSFPVVADRPERFLVPVVAFVT